jgi:hypothetical protein
MDRHAHLSFPFILHWHSIILDNQWCFNCLDHVTRQKYSAGAGAICNDSFTAINSANNLGTSCSHRNPRLHHPLETLPWKSNSRSVIMDNNNHLRLQSHALGFDFMLDSQLLA